MQLKAIPETLKLDLAVPLYRSSGKDLIQVNKPRGVILLSVMFEFLLLDRLQSVLLELNILHQNQSTYKKKIYAEAMLTAQGAISRYLKSGSQIVTCLYNLKKAFDSVIFPVLFHRLYNVRG